MQIAVGNIVSEYATSATLTLGSWTNLIAHYVDPAVVEFYVNGQLFGPGRLVKQYSVVSPDVGLTPNIGRCANNTAYTAMQLNRFDGWGSRHDADFFRNFYETTAPGRCLQ